MTQAVPPSLAIDDRDRRLDHAMDLLTQRAPRGNGGLAFVAVGGLMLSGALLATVLGGHPQTQAVAPPAEVAAAPAATAPKADFELSAAAAPAAVEVAPAGSEQSR